MPQTPKLAKPQPSNKASGDWCSELIYLPPDPSLPDSPKGRVTSVNLYHPPVPLSSGTVSFTADHVYQTGFATDSPYTTHFTTSCLNAHGANPSCSDLAEQIIAHYVMPNYTRLSCCSPYSPADQCLSDSSNGCDCSYSYRTVNADSGAWQVSDNILYMFSSSNRTEPVNQTTFCARGDQLTFTGREGQSLFNIMGLRTVALVRGPDGGAM